MSNVVPFTGKYHGYRHTTCDNELWITCVPFYGHQLRVAHRLKHILRLEHKK